MLDKSSILSIVLAVGVLVADDGHAVQSLFTAADTDSHPVGAEHAVSVLRSRVVEVDLEQLVASDGGPATTLVLNLFPDVVYTARLDRVGGLESGGSYWTGQLKESSSGSASLVIHDRAMTGTINTGEALFQIRHLREALHSVQQIDPSSYALELEPIEVHGVEGDLPESLGAADDGSVIDILVVYTPAAKNAAGGTTAIENLIDLAVVETNQSYSNSGINQRLTLRDIHEVAYSEAAFNWGTTLSRLAGTTDGYMDGVHDLRNASCADAVVLIVGDTSYCGMAYIMASVSSSFADSAFSLVSWTCATGYYSFGHELGHNMGARHDWYVDDSTSPYAHSHGFVNYPDRWRTIMAYNSECSDLGSSCSRLQYWSNPAVTYGGDPMGVAAGTSTSCNEGVPAPLCDADNHLSLDKTALTFANFRDGSVCEAPATVFGDGFESGDTSAWTADTM